MKGFFIFPILLIFLSACATKPFLPSPIELATFTERAVTQTVKIVEVAAAVPGADEVVALTGLDLYSQGIQPIWIRIQNQGNKRIRLAIWSIDNEYFSPLEVAWKNRKGYSEKGRVEMERWLIGQALDGMIRAVEQQQDARLDVLKGKTAISELAESVMTRLCRSIGGGTFSRHSPFGFWFEDVRALGFLRPPWGLAFETLIDGMATE